MGMATHLLAGLLRLLRCDARAHPHLVRLVVIAHVCCAVGAGGAVRIRLRAPLSSSCRSLRRVVQPLVCVDLAWTVVPPCMMVAEAVLQWVHMLM